MASIGMIRLLSDNIASNTSSTSQTTSQKSTQFVGFLKVENHAAGTYTVKIEHSGNGVDWADLVSFTAISADGSEYINVTTSVLPNVRASVEVTSGDADITVDLFFDPNK